MVTQIVSPGLRPTSSLRPSSTLRPSYLRYQDYDVPIINGQYELGGVVFGTRDPRLNPNPYLVKSFEIEPGALTNGSGGNLSQASGTTGVLTSDASYPNEDGTKFGQDFYTGMVLTFSIDIWERGQVSYDTIGPLKSAWRTKKHRETANELTTLRICRGGRTRRVYGRPRKFKETYGHVEQGYVPIDCQFQAADECFYDDAQNIKTIGLVNQPNNGMSYPTTYPKRYHTTGVAATTVQIDGHYPTFPQFKINGPINYPTISLANGWTIKINAIMHQYDYIIIDPRPWERKATFYAPNGIVINAAGYFTQSSPTMREMALEPGTHTINFGGVDPTLSGYLEIGWRNAWATP